MSAAFQSGQRVVMVTPFKQHVLERAMDEGVTLPVVGPIYTIRNIEPGEGWNVGKTYLRVMEIWNGPHISDGIEPSFDASMFRPVAERKTDLGMSMLRSLLNTQPDEVIA